MTALLLQSVWRLLLLVRRVIVPGHFPGWSNYFRRVTMLALLAPPFVAVQAMHWIGLLLDEILFPAYRRVRVERPVFIVGAPRSGTTFLHRLLASDPRFVTFSTWECLFAPSLCQRHLVSGLLRLDLAIGRPLGRAWARVEPIVARRVAEAHPMSLADAEEDYFVLMPLLDCFVLVVAFPEARWLWRLSSFDTAVPARERQRILGWYRRCLQRHLYFHGASRQLLSKNASFAGMVGSLARDYPDGRFVVCERDAVQAARSQLNALAPALDLVGPGADDERFRECLLDTLANYYHNLERLAARLPAARRRSVALYELSHRPRDVLTTMYRDWFDAGVPPSLDVELARYEARSTPPRPATATNPDDASVAPALMRRFARWRHAEGARL